ncbi:MarR family winged helix-turn-helix transcriptional regulator [Methanospirillum lacunae]|uniref:MarR family transcriptional regulator n=1 Tax=Methanospirillum lacunae TaxID=668570 RepID=A0A2V2N4I3_9EURY|nr:MarR family transcriptional regulator [Methanospirillum lacunae]PWR74729.1 MarR family transcriptional regulator [Methanospirillum lacunae]
MSKGNAIALISRVREKANRLIVHELEEHGITGIVPSHGDILHFLYLEKCCTMKDLATKIHRSKPNVTVLVNKLVELGYVKKEKSTDDNRVTYISLTEKGESLKPVFIYVSKKLQKAVYGGLSDEESELLERLLQKVYDEFPKLE